MKRLLSILSLFVFITGTSALAHEVRINGEEITLKARKTPLQDILADFVQAGITVKIDPDINTRVSGSVKDMDLSDALEKLLDPYGYVLTWETVPGPLGDFTRLSEIQVFRLDKPRNIKPFMPEENFRITRGPMSDSPEFVADELLIALRPGTNIEQFKLLLAQIGGSVIGSVPDLGIYRIRLPANSNVLALIDLLKTNNIVSRVEPNYAYRLPESSRVDEKSNKASLTASGAKAGVPPVAVLDSGIRMLSSMNNLVVGSYDAVHPDCVVDDRAGHGTQMALIASGAVSPNGTAGSDAGVPVIAIRAFDDNGYTTSYALMGALNYADDQGAKVINMSWGTETPSSFLESAMRNAQSRGMIVVASAGNEPTGNPVYPAAYPGVVSVSALKSDGTPWERSNYGSTVTIAAPGTASFPVGYNGPPGGYAGTSIASAYVARNFALYFGNNPKASTTAAKSSVIGSVTPLPGVNRYGRGSLDDEAVDRLLE